MSFTFNLPDRKTVSDLMTRSAERVGRLISKRIEQAILFPDRTEIEKRRKPTITVVQSNSHEVELGPYDDE